MFEKIVLRRGQQTGRLGTIDPGYLAECLIFYSDVKVLVAHGTLIDLIRKMGIESFEKLVLENHANVYFLLDNPSTITVKDKLGDDAHAFGVYRAARARGVDKEPIDFIRDCVERAIERPGKARRIASRLLPRIEFLDLKTISPGFDLCRTTQQDLLEHPDFVRAAVAAAIRELAPGYDLFADWTFDIAEHPGGGLQVRTNLDFEALNSAHRESFPGTTHTWNVAFLLSNFIEASEEIGCASYFDADIATNPVYGSVMQNKISDILESTTKSEQSREAFQSLVYNNARALRSCLNTGERTFDEFFPVLEKAQKFHHWIRGRDPEEELIHSYYKEITSKTWIDKLPVKAARFTFFTVAGSLLDSIAPGAGAGLGAANEFVLNKFIRRWRPNQFIEGPLRDFVTPIIRTPS